MESQSAVAKGALESRNKLAAKDATEHLDGKKEGVASFDPVGVIERRVRRQGPRNGHAGEVRAFDSKCAAR